MNQQTEIQQLRASAPKLPKVNNGRYPVIVSTEYQKGKSCLGIQFWTPQEINQKTSINPDQTLSQLIELL
jgi:hypothetical protein